MCAAFAFIGLLNVWLAIPLLLSGTSATFVFTLMAAKGVWLFSTAPLFVRVEAKTSVREYLLFAATLVLLTIGSPWLSPRTLTLAWYVAVFLGIVMHVYPLFGYGRFGREMNEAVKEEEGASWRN